jgi:hypothetical protein
MKFFKHIKISRFYLFVKCVWNWTCTIIQQFIHVIRNGKHWPWLSVYTNCGYFVSIACFSINNRWYWYTYELFEIHSFVSYINRYIVLWLSVPKNHSLELQKNFPSVSLNESCLKLLSAISGWTKNFSS